MSRHPAALRFEPPVLEAPPRPATAAERARRAEDLTAAAVEAGRREGLAAARAEVDAAAQAHAAAQARLDSATAALRAAAATLLDHDRTVLRDVEAHVIAIAVALAESVLGRELAAADAGVLDAVRRAAALVPERGRIELHLHPGDAATAADEAVAALFDEWRDVRVVPDRGVEPGGCVVHVGPLQIDAQVGPAVERMRALLATG